MFGVEGGEDLLLHNRLQSGPLMFIEIEKIRLHNMLFYFKKIGYSIKYLALRNHLKCQYFEKSVPSTSSTVESH